MRRVLRKISAGEGDQLGDLSTLADPSVVDSIVRWFLSSLAVACSFADGLLVTHRSQKTKFEEVPIKK